MSEEKKALIEKVKKMTAIVGAMTKLKEPKPVTRPLKEKPEKA